MIESIDPIVHCICVGKIPSGCAVVYDGNNATKDTCTGVTRRHVIRFNYKNHYFYDIIGITLGDIDYYDGMIAEVARRIFWDRLGKLVDEDE